MSDNTFEFIVRAAIIIISAIHLIIAILLAIVGLWGPAIITAACGLATFFSPRIVGE